MTSLIFLASFTLTVLLSGSSADVTCYSGQFFKYPLDKKKYVLDENFKSDEVSFQFTTEDNYPELPSWVQLEQRTKTSQAFLYGSPQEWAETSTVEVIGWDKLNGYTTKREKEVLDVMPNQNGFPYFQAEFLVKNKNLDDFLQSDDESKILQICKDNYYPADDLQVTGVESALNRGGRIPLPDSTGHEGVFIRVGSHKNVNDTSPKYALKPGKKPAKDAFVSDGNNFVVKWEEFTWLDLRTLESPDAKRQALLPEDTIPEMTEYAPRKFDDSPRDFHSEFVLVVILPLIIILLIVLLLSFIMCCGREGRKKRDDKTPNMQLTHHHNIQRSTLRLRELSKPSDHDQSSQSPSRDASSPSRRGQNDYSRLPEEGDEDRVEGRNAPPPYRMPPGSGASGGQQV